MQRRFLSNYRFWLLLGLLLVGWPAYAQEQGFFALLDEDRRREFTLELGPSFMEDPVFRSFTDASGIIHPATKISLKTARHISATFGWRLNDWLRVQASINFNAADFGGASSTNSEEERLTEIFRDGSPNFEEPSSRDLIEGAVGGAVVDGTRSGGIVLPLLRQGSNEAGFNAASLDSITDTPEYMVAFDPDDMDDPCDDACARMRAETAIRTAAGNARQMADEDTNAEAAMRAGEIARAQAEFSSQTSYSAEGTFFGIGSFLSAYADIPLTSGIWLYGGGGAGISWSHVKEGFYSRSTTLTLNNDNGELDAIQQMIEADPDIQPRLAALGIDDLNEISTGTTLSNFSDTHSPQRTDIISTITSFAMTGAVGFRTEVFEGLVVDSGYQVIWTQKGFYRGADEKIAHLVRVGFVFNF